MFPLPYKPPLNWIMYALFGLEFALLAGGLIFGTLDVTKTSRLPRPLRMLLSANLVLCAFLGWRVGALGTRVQTFAALIFCGMTADFVGDLIMAKLIRIPNRLVFGMATFGVGNLFYIAALLYLTSLSGFFDVRTQSIALAVMLVWSAGAWWVWVRKPGGSRALNAGSLVYGLLIGAMSALAIALALKETSYLSLAVGTLLFFVSDLILGNWTIRGHIWTAVNDVIWTAYASGQLLIVYSVAAALNTLH
jgi:hypothetical protein